MYMTYMYITHTHICDLDFTSEIKQDIYLSECGLFYLAGRSPGPLSLQMP